MTRARGEQGTTDKKGECQTCKGKLADCGGHYGARRRRPGARRTGLSSRAGYIRLELPVFHVGYFKNIVAILQCVCKTCAHVMVPEDERRQYLRRFRSPQTEVRRLRRLSALQGGTLRLAHAGEHAPRAVQEADGALQALQAVPVLRSHAGCVAALPPACLCWRDSLLQVS